MRCAIGSFFPSPMPALVITPVKDALGATLTTIEAIQSGELPLEYRVYNDYSSPETEKGLEKAAKQHKFQLIHLRDLTDAPSPNYKTVLQHAQKYALAQNLSLIIVESDVTVKKDTLSKLIAFSEQHPSTGLVGAVTVDEQNKVNFPYLKFKDEKASLINTKRSLSFCCTLLSNRFLHSYDFSHLDTSKDWFDTHISKKSLENGFENVVLMDTRVLHRPHGSRPWKQLKYTNPVKYYLNKFFKGRDKI
ncbi:glycosyltransferase [Lunatimonas salinarum]|uniref:glycosyltransferase n=1 Tax=Lunatimonas salinarum TaxID=1774590 RepID=UPI0031584F02